MTQEKLVQNKYNDIGVMNCLSKNEKEMSKV